MFGRHAGSNQRVRARQRSMHRVRAGGIRRKIVIFLLLMIGFVGVLPIVIAKTHLRNVLLSMAIPNKAVRVTIGDASISWISKPSLTNVEVKDTNGETLLVAESIQIDRTPLKLAMNTRELGTIHIIHPTLHVQVRRDGNSISDLLQRLRGNSAADDQPASLDTTRQTSNVEVKQAPHAPDRQVAFAIELVGATVIADDVATSRQWRMQNVNIQYDGHAGAAHLGAASASGDILAIDRGMAPLPAGRFALLLKPGDAGRTEINLQADRIALAVAEPWLRELEAGTELSGSLSGQATATFTLHPGELPIDLITSGSFTIDQLNATTPKLQGDRVRLARIELPWRITAQPTGLAIQELQVRSDVAELAVHGQLDPKAIEPGNSAVSSLVQFAAGRNDIEVRGTADLAKLAAMLPHYVRVRSDTAITSGTANVSASVKPTSDGSEVQGSISAAQLAGTRNGKPIQWDQPINANVSVRQAKGAIADGLLKCDSKFLRVEAAGTLQQLTARANFDLNALAEQLGQFIDLSGIQLTGTGTAQVAWQQPAAGTFSATANSEFSQLRVRMGSKSICNEPQLSLQAQASGAADVRTFYPTRIDTARLQLNGQGDQLDARLADVDLTKSNTVWAVGIHSTGNISRWLSRVSPWVSVDPWKIDGGSDFTANVRVAGTTFDATDTKLVITDLRATNPEWNINEPRVEFAGDAHWNGTTGEFGANSAQLVSSTVALAAKSIRYGGNQPTSQLAGAAAFRADLGRVGAWRTQPNRPAQYQPAGQLSGNLRITQVSGRIAGELTAAGQNLSLTAGNQTIWQEPQLTIQGSATYDAAADGLSFDQFQIHSNTLQAAVAGQVQKLSTVADCKLNGTLNYDLAQVTPLLRPYLGGGVQLTGREQARFAMAGKLSDGLLPKAQLTAMTRDPYTTTALNSGTSSTHWSRRIRAQLELPWTGANVYGLPVGAGKIGATLGDGALRIAPVALSVGEGQLTAAPNVQFDPEPAVLSLPAGPVLTNVRISPEVSESMLKFVAPVLAGATQSDGLFSLQLEGARVPLVEPRRAESSGQITVHSVRVVPGQTATPWVGLGQQIEALVKRRDPASLTGRQVTLVSIRDQQVNFRVKDGRVYHQTIEFQIGDVTMRSQGSVGFDETIDLVLQIPVQDAWIAKEPLLSGLKGQVLQVPVSGTLTKPKMDQRALTHVTSQLIQKGAGQAVGNELNKALDKFLKPR